MADIGDVASNGINDCAIGAYLDDQGGANVGAVYVLTLAPGFTTATSTKIGHYLGGFVTLQHPLWIVTAPRACVGRNRRIGRAGASVPEKTA